MRLDFDNKGWIDDYIKRSCSVKFWLGKVGVNVLDEKFYRSESGNAHVEMLLDKDLSDMQVVALQAILGSDPVREMLNWRRVYIGRKNWNILFEHEEVKLT